MTIRDIIAAATLVDVRRIDAYRRGLTHDIHHYGWRLGTRRWWRHICYCIRRRDWRGVRNATWRGWLAEPEPFPAGLTRCGTGWTKRQAIADLHRHAKRCGVTLVVWEETP